MLTRSKPLRSRGFQSMEPERLRRQRAASRAANIDMLLATTGRHAVMTGSTSGVPIEKECASQSRAYQDAVRSIGYCQRCGCTLAKGRRQFCHRDQGKGTGIKTDVLGGWLGCSGCHFWVGTSGSMPKEQRRAVEDYLGWKTRTTLRKKRIWPPRVADTWAELDATPIINPELTEDECN